MPIFEEVRTVTADRRLVVPWVIQRALGLEHGGPVRFRVENGIVTLLSVDARKPEAAKAVAQGMNNAEPRRTDFRSALTEELKTLLAAAERNRPDEIVALPNPVARGRPVARWIKIILTSSRRLTNALPRLG